MQAITNTGLQSLRGVEIEATPWYVDPVGTPPYGSDRPSLPPSLTELSVAGPASGAFAALSVNGTMPQPLATGLAPGDRSHLWMRINTEGHLVEDVTLVQHVAYVAECAEFSASIPTSGTAAPTAVFGAGGGGTANGTASPQVVAPPPTVVSTVTFVGGGGGGPAGGTYPPAGSAAPRADSRHSVYVVPAYAALPPAGASPPESLPPPSLVVVDPARGIPHNFTGTGDGVVLINVAGLVADAAPPLDGSESSTVVFPSPETVVPTPFAEVTFPAGATASHVPASGRLALYATGGPSHEQAQRTLAYDGSGRVVPQRVVEVGYGQSRITFDMPVRILLDGQAGGRAFYVEGANGTITPIDGACAADDAARVHRQLDGAGECQMDSDGGGKIIHTYHLTRFGTVLSENGAPPPVVHTCSVRLGVPNLAMSASPGGYSKGAQQDLVNSGSLQFARVDLEATPWYVGWSGSAPPGAGYSPSLNASITEVREEGDYVAVSEGVDMANGLGGGQEAPLSFRLNLTAYGKDVVAPGSTLAQYITYLAQCSPP